MKLIENIMVALRSLRGNLVRAFLTLMMIAFGIMALVGILTAIDQVIYSLNDNFASLGANSFSIRPAGQGLRGEGQKRADMISYKQALQFKENFEDTAPTSINLNCGGSKVVRYKDEQTDPTFALSGIDENYFVNRGINISNGRGFTINEVSGGDNVAIVGSDVVKELYKDSNDEALGKQVIVDNKRYFIIGIVESRGKSNRDSEDKSVFIPLYTAKRFYGSPNLNYRVEVAVQTQQEMDATIAAATGVFRPIRGLKAAQKNDFEIRKSDGLVQLIKENTVSLRSGAVAIGLMTLLGAAIGLMNIMLVSVTERTREIGVRKALGAKNKNILVQFLTEAIVMCQIGGFVGVVLALLVGLLISHFAGGGFVMPWGWIALAVFVSFVTGLLAGIIPARKAAKMDPIESLRYE
jgi:putative ABC transport system permease protein